MQGRLDIGRPPSGTNGRVVGTPANKTGGPPHALKPGLMDEHPSARTKPAGRDKHCRSVHSRVFQRGEEDPLSSQAAHRKLTEQD